MPQIDIPKQLRADLVTSIQRYFTENMTEPIGALEAGLLLDYFLEEAGPAIYNQGVSDTQARIQSRVGDVSGELSLDEMQYWLRRDGRKRRG